MLQRGSRHGKFNGSLGIPAVEQRVDQPAAEKGKDVLCVLELRARFDEQSNIDYSPSYSMPAQSLSLAEMEVRRVMATFSNPKRSASCLATDL